MRWKLLTLVSVVLASGCVHSSELNQSEPETSQTSEMSDLSDTRTVYLTESGFEPEELVIEQNGTVTWVNNASQQMWVGSDTRPTHTEYSGSRLREHCENGDQNTAAFDQCSTGDRFSFTFSKTGEWSYHNHESPGQQGTIIVQ